MKRIIRLTESDLERIVRRVISEQDEEWGETDKGEEELQDLIQDARDFLESECGYEIQELNEMSEQDIVESLYDEGNNELAKEIEELLNQEGFDTELDENWDDFDMKRKYDKYKRIDYRKVPKNPIEPGSYLDYEGTKLKKSDNDDDDFNEWGMDGDDEEYV
jgi:hypothetical protein